MSEYIILIIILTLLILAFLYLVKAIRTISINELHMIKDDDILIKKQLLLKNNLEELEIDLVSQKLDNEEYNSLKIGLQKKLSSITNSLYLKNTEDKTFVLDKNGENNIIKNDLICQNCQKELECDSKFCKFCGAKVNI